MYKIKYMETILEKEIKTKNKEKSNDNDIDMELVVMKPNWFVPFLPQDLAAMCHQYITKSTELLTFG